VAQIVFASLVLASLAFGVAFEMAQDIIMAIVAALTLASAGLYLREWVLHMSAADLKR
jgi:cardiolipin synthase (CMP-forming)